ncbi:MAG: UDP-N-acetylmuramoyl-L-alanine--D-glutamate ligase [Alphaproteobacteria bacterium]
MQNTAPKPDLGFLAGKAVAVMGLGVSGLSAARALADAGAQVTCWDDGEQARDKGQALGLRVADLGSAVLGGFTAIIWSPGIPHTHPAPHPVAQAAQEAGVPLICDIELLLRARPAAPFIGITGTNGKSTTTALTTHLLEQSGIDAQAGGNIGAAALDMQARRGTTHVLELSSYQTELTHSRAFGTAALTNITPDHLERHGGMAGYIKAKRRLFDLQPDGATAVIGVDGSPGQTIADALERDGRHLVIRVSVERSLGQGVYVCDSGVLLDVLEGGSPVEVCDLTTCPALPGRHNWQNAAIAYALCRMQGASRQDLAAGFASFGGLPHRQQLVAAHQGIRFVNDSKATNAEATAKALASYDRCVWIVGGQAKATGLDGLEDLAPRVAHALVIGEERQVYLDWLAANTVPHTDCQTLEDAVPAALQQAVESETPTILLSPAAASWDQYPNFEARGEHFATLANALCKEPA